MTAPATDLWGDPIPGASEYIDATFGKDGYLARKWGAGYSPREGQIALSRAVDHAIRTRTHLLSEAPCGTGKSISYSVPATYHAAVHGQTVVIVTANISLQEQLVKKDLPLLAEILPWSFSFGLMKGRANYLCRSQFEKIRLAERQESMFADERNLPANERDRVRLTQWAEAEVAREGFGDASTIGWKPSDKLWREFSVGPEDCRGQRCAFARPCGALAAQRKARKSQVVVTNYHVFFTHLLIYAQRGIDAILPSFDAVICDEAHALAGVASDFFGWRASEGSFRKLARYVRGTDPRLMEEIERAAGFFFEQMLSLKHDRDRYKAHVVPSRLNRHDVEACEGLLARLSEFTQRVDKDLAYLEGESEEASDAERAKERALKLSNAVASVLNGPSDDEVVFVEEDEFRKASVACRLVRPGKVLHGALFSRTITKPKDPEDPDAPDPEPQPVSVVCTSATLATDSGFGFAKEELGVAECAELVVESPFDFENQALMILPKLCDPSDPLFTSECAAVLLRTIVLARGRTLGLFTSRKRMNEVYDLVAGKTPYRILRQDDGQRTALVEEFRRDTHSVLLGVASFWAGVDVPGESLSVVFIDKIPFPQPDDPVVERRTETDKATFFNYVVPKSIIELKQGVGRLIRSSTDRGVIVVCDRRIHPKVKRYSNRILRSMPAGMQKVHNLESIADWLDDPGALAVAEPPPASPPVEEIDPFS